MSAPLVSVCIPVRDQARFLGEAIESALAQDLDGLEVLVHDDASTDGTVAVLDRFGGDPRVRALSHPRPLGVAENRNSLLRAARGRYVAWLDADDAYLPGALARQVALLASRPGAALAHGAPEIVDADGTPRTPFRRPFEHDAVEPSRWAFGELILANELTTSTVVARRDAHLATGPFVAVGASSSDWDMWLRLALRGEVAYSAAPVARYRQHAASISHGSTAGGERLRCDARVVRRVLRSERARIADRSWIARRAHAALAAKALLHAGDAQARGERAEALRAVSLAARMRPRTLAGMLSRLTAACARGDRYAWHATARTALGRLAGELEGSRYGDALARGVAADAAWDASLARVARTVRHVTPADAVLGTVTKWDPTLLHLSGRRGRNFPDLASLPDGYPRDDAAALAHLDRLRAEGLSHLVFPSMSLWWLDHYAGLAARLRAPGPPLHADEDCVIFDLRTP